MTKKAVAEIWIDGVNVTDRISPLLISLSVSDRAGMSSDSASIELDDTNGRAILPSDKAAVSIKLGWEGEGVAEIFRGTVDGSPRADGGRGGRTISITAKSMDVRGKAKQGQRRHFDDETIEKALQETGREAGVTVAVDPSFASIKRSYIGLENESFAEFGERIAREVGGTFKIVGDRAVLVKRNGGINAAGAALATVQAIWGENLHDYSITPIAGRWLEKSVRTRWYDPKTAEYKTTDAETGTEGASTVYEDTLTASNEQDAQRRATSLAAELDRESGEGTVTIEGNIGAQPEGSCVVAKCRPGIDGTYRIEGVTHDYSRSGWVTRLDLGQPKGDAGKDKRGEKSTGNEDDDFSLPADGEVG
ncbi:phage late control D family protein [Agrobacterium salinitolerans]